MPRLAVLVLLLTACEVGGECLDEDLDGYGPGCELGEDCDPENAARNADCRSVPPPDCALDPAATGCPCLPGAVAGCFDEADGVGVCVGGRTICVAGHWGICEGGTGPRSERCDGVDQDCDGRVDEGVLSPCGGCNSACRGGIWGPEPEPFEVTDGFALTRFDELTLATVEQRFGAIWVANSADGTLSRIDAGEALETARYATGGAEPSRVAVDHLGDAWVLNREFGGRSTVTKVAGTLERCVDRDGDGVQTSSGPDDVLPFGEDECVLLSAPVGEAGGLARAIAIDGDRGLDAASGGDAWIGLHDAELIVELDGFTGEERSRVPTPGFAPYAATFDPWGTLWMIARDGLLARVDVRAEPPEVELLEVPYACFLLYGLAADRDGRLLMTGFGCDLVFSYDPDLSRWNYAPAPSSPRAATFGDDSFWIAHTAGMVSEVSLAPLTIRRTLSLTDADVTPIESIGVAVDALGSVWAASSSGGGDGLGVATRVDPEREQVSAQVTVGGAPHVQGDLAGNRVRFRPVEEASTSRVFDGCLADDTEWRAVHVRADAGGGGTIVLELRHARTADELRDAPFVRLGEIPSAPPPWPLALPAGGVVELRMTLAVEGYSGAPRVQLVGVEWSCPGPD